MAKIEHKSIRFLSLLLIVLGVVGFSFNPNCPKAGCPSYALANCWILKSERGVALIALAIFAISILWRMLLHGKLPDQISKDGFGWKETAETVNKNVEDVLAQVKSLDDDFVLIKREVEHLKNKTEGT